MRTALAIAVFVVLVPPSMVGSECTPIVGSEDLLEPGSIVLLGEIHGTTQGPEAVSRLTCVALEHGRRVSVALEIPKGEQPFIDQYLDGDNISTLLGTGFWQRDYQDGRSSRAMLELLSTLRDYARDTERVRVVAIDDPDAANGRDAYMAERVHHEISSAPQDVVIVLVGNLHNRLVAGNRWNPSYEPMGYLLGNMGHTQHLVSLRLTHGGGSAWVCTGSTPGDCGERELNGDDGLELGIEMFEASTDNAYSGRLHLGHIDASPPAKQP